MEKWISVEVGFFFGWCEYVGFKGKILVVYMFGCSGVYMKVFEKYGFIVENIIDVV